MKAFHYVGSCPSVTNALCNSEVCLWSCGQLYQDQCFHGYTHSTCQSVFVCVLCCEYTLLILSVSYCIIQCTILFFKIKRMIQSSTWSVSTSTMIQTLLLTALLSLILYYTNRSVWQQIGFPSLVGITSLGHLLGSHNECIHCSF